MKERAWSRVAALLLALVMSVTLLTGCAGRSAAGEEAPIRVYLWTTNLYEKYAPYIQAQLPDVEVEFVVGNNDLNFYEFLKENGALPDVITCCRFSLHDARPLKDSLLDLSTSNEAGAVYNTYLSSFRNEDGSVNWLPVCADAHGFVVNRDLFEAYGIPLPTDYDSFVSACRAFEAVGIRGFTADYLYDYACMETLQGLSATELSSREGRKWRTAYSDPANTEPVGLDDTVWPEVFARMERFIRDTKLGPADLELNYDEVTELYRSGQLAMYFGSSAGVSPFREEGIDTVFLPFFCENGEKWLMTTPYFQVALNRNLEQDEARREKTMKVLKVMLSAEAQNIICNGQDTLSYSQSVPLRFTDALADVRPVVEENHMYIRIASNAFFSASQEVVSGMIAGEYSAAQAYTAFDSQLRAPEETAEETVLAVERTYSNTFCPEGGNEGNSVMANTLRGIYGTDVLIATGDSFTGSLLQADYTKRMARSMIMPNGLMAYRGKMSGAELKETVRAFVEGCQGGFTPFNRGALPTVSGIAMEVTEDKGTYTLKTLTKGGKAIEDGDMFSVTCLATAKRIAPLLAKEGCVFEEDGIAVKETWTKYITEGNAALAYPESYITLR